MKELDRSEIKQVLEAHGIPLESLERPTPGMINQTLIINDKYVLRLDIFMPDVVPSRYLGEARAYTILKAAGFPVPEIITIDVSRRIVPVPYTLMTRLPGTPLAYLWKALLPDEQASLARQSGALMAQMHEVPMETYGWLASLDTHPLSSALELTETFFYGLLEVAVKKNMFDTAFHARFRRLWEHVKPLVAEVRRPHLIHRDFQFENILVQDGRVTGLIDFEWGAVGDPTWDFMVDRQREYQCPGSTTHFYEGYRSKRDLPAHVPILSLFYLFTLELDMTVNGTDAHGLIPISSMPRLISVLETLEALSF